MRNQTIDAATVRLALVKRRPFLARAAFACRFRLIEDFRAQNPGGWACDPQWRIFVDPKEFEDTPLRELVAKFEHELGHLTRNHSARFKRIPLGPNGEEPNHVRWNIAGDCEINDNVALCRELPDWVCYPRKFRMPDHLLVEEYWKLLPESPKGGEGPGDGPPGDGPPGGNGPPGKYAKGGKGPDCGSGSDGKPRPWDLGPSTKKDPGLKPGEDDIITRGVAKDIQEHAKRQGHVPSSWEEWAAQELEPPSIPWTQVFAQYLRSAVQMTVGAHDYTFRKRNRRQDSYGDIIMPATYRPQLEVAVVLDSSGSMSEDDLALACAEVSGMLRALHASVTVVCCDTQVGAMQRISRAQEIQIDRRGGTDMTVGLAAAMKATPRPHVVVCLTDGYTGWPDRRLHAPLIIGIVGDMENVVEYSPLPEWAQAVEISVE